MTNNIIPINIQKQTLKFKQDRQEYRHFCFHIFIVGIKETKYIYLMCLLLKGFFKISIWLVMQKHDKNVVHRTIYFEGP